MNILKLSFSSLRYNRVSNIFNVLVLASGIAVIVTFVNLNDKIQRRFENDLAGVDLVVGAKGSPIQLILSSVFHIDVPNGNISLTDAKKIENNPQVKSAIPVSLGDNYKDFRIVGTTVDYPKHYGATLQNGDYWKKDMQAVIGSEVARITNLQVGQKFAGSHGLGEGGEEHGEYPYLVSGVLAPTGTVIDRLVLTDLASVWHIHEHHHSDEEEYSEKHKEKEITALLVTYKSPLAAATLPRIINHSSAMQAASPAFEIAHLSKFLGIGSEVAQVFGIALVIIATAGFFMTLFNAVSDRKYDIALLRVLGATRNKVFSFVLMEGMTLGIAGTVSGIIFGHIFTYFVTCWIESTMHIMLGGAVFHLYEIVGGLVAISVSVVASLIPAVIAYSVNVSEAISRGA